LSIGKEVVFGLDNFQQPKMLSDKETIAQNILNLLFMRPGNLPSLPHIGINIKQYLYKLDSGIDPEEIKDKIYNQCSAVIPYIVLGDIRLFIAEQNGTSMLLLVIPIEGSDAIIYGFQKESSTGGVLFNYDFTTNVMNNTTI
jgi:hypothetical protein